MATLQNQCLSESYREPAQTSTDTTKSKEHRDARLPHRVHGAPLSPFEWFKWACSVDTGGPGAQAVLFGIVRHVDADGVCWAGQETIARNASAKPRSVRNNIPKLVALGLVEIVKRPGRSDVYRLTPERYAATPENVAANPARSSARKELPEPRKDLPQPRKELPDTPARIAYEVSKEESKEESTEETTDVSACEPKPPTDAERLRVVYAEERTRLKPSARIRGGWPSTWGVNARLKQHGFEAMARMIRWAHRSTHSRARWLRGEHPDASEALGQTLFRKSKCAEYVELSADWHEGNDRPTATTKQRDPWRALLALPSFASPQRRNPPVRGKRVVWPLVQLDSAPTDADRQEHARRHRALVAAGGWVAWCNLSHPLDRQRFERAFRAAYDAEGVA